MDGIDFGLFSRYRVGGKARPLDARDVARLMQNLSAARSIVPQQEAAQQPPQQAPAPRPPGEQRYDLQTLERILRQFQGPSEAY